MNMKAIGLNLAVCALLVFAFAGCESIGGGGGMSDEEMIRSLVDDAMAGLKAQDIDAMVADYADSFKSDQGGDTAEMKEFLEGAKEQGFLDDIEVDLSSMVITVDGNKATAKPIELEAPSIGSLTLEYDLEKIDGRWQVTYSAQF